MDVTETAAAIVREHGPLSLADFAGRVRASGIEVDDDVARFVYSLDDDSVMALGDLVVSRDQIQNGRVFTHVLTEAEAAGGYVVDDADLEVVFGAMSGSAPLAGGGEVSFVFGDDDDSRVAGPDGWLAGFSPGDLLAFRCDDGVVSVGASADPVPDDSLVSLLRASFEVEARTDGIAMAWGVVAHLSAAHSDVFAVARRPLTEWLAAAGLEWVSGWLAPVGFDWDAHWAARRDLHGAELADEYGLDEIDGRLLADLALAFTDAWTADGGVAVVEPELLERAAVALTSPLATAAWLGPSAGPLSTGVDGATVDRLDGLLDQVLAYDPRHQPAGAYAAKARAAEWRGDARAQETYVRRALAIDNEFDVAIVDAAYLAGERGDALRMRALLDQVESEDYVATVTAERYTAPGPMAAGRNDRCPCGSGRKHKDCCHRFNGHSLVDRVPWLWAKLYAFVTREVRVETRWKLALVCVGEPDEYEELSEGDADAVAVVADAVHDLRLLDLVLFEGGAAARFVEERGAMLPADELNLAAQWVGCRHRLFRATGPDGGVVDLVDVVSGERLTAQVGLSSDEYAGQAMLAVVLPLPGGGWRMSGCGIEVPDDDVDDVAALLRDGDVSAEVLAEVVLSPRLWAEVES